MVVYKMFMTSLMGPIEWLLSSRWVVKLDFRILCLKSLKCSLYLLRNNLPVWPTYFMWQSGHVRQYSVYNDAPQVGSA